MALIQPTCMSEVIALSPARLKNSPLFNNLALKAAVLSCSAKDVAPSPAGLQNSPLFNNLTLNALCLPVHLRKSFYLPVQVKMLLCLP
ncbi:hypothetical protein AMELA_G00020110, partial [Ameiurus melas]